MLHSNKVTAIFTKLFVGSTCTRWVSITRYIDVFDAIN